MPRYLLHRLANMALTLLGVLILTFVLFHVVGGSPAEVVLGKNATAATLEEYECRRGLDKPLLFGSHARTRAFVDADAAALARRWVTPLDEAGKAVRLPPGRYPLAPACPPARGGPFEWRIRLQVAPGTQARFECGDGGAAAELAGGGWRAASCAMPGTNAAIVVAAGTLDVSAVRLRRRQGNPFDSQFFAYLSQVARLDFGESALTGEPVLHILREGVGPSLVLMIPIFTGGLVAALVLGLVSAYARGRWPDRVLVVLSTALMSVNYVVWVIAGQYLFAFRLGWFPVWGYESARYLLLPVLIGIVSGLGRDVRFYRTVMLDEMYRDYVRTARAKGAGPGRILLRHVLPNAMIPVVTNVSMALPFLFTGSLLLESSFGIPGLGGAGINAIQSADYDVLRAIVVLSAVLYVVINLLTDLLYGRLDPRVRLA